ncbi:MAG: hypothetical protein H7X86_06425 [Gorillibacterium sp.]|nr:hypothetical protein [Gorillibacterium sp.]
MPQAKHTQIELGNIIVTQLDSGSGIFIGSNAQWGWSSHGKNVSGFGTVAGMLNRLTNNISVVYDNDLIDTLIDDRDTMISRVGGDDERKVTYPPFAE